MKAWTVGQLRNALSGLLDDMPILVDAAEEPGGDTVQEQVLIPTLALAMELTAAETRCRTGFPDRLCVPVSSTPIMATFTTPRARKEQ